MFSIWVLIMEQKGSTRIFRINWDKQTKGAENARKLPCFSLPACAHAQPFKTTCAISFNWVLSIRSTARRGGKVKVAQLCLTFCYPMDYTACNSPGQNTGVGSLSLLQGIFPTQGLNPGLQLAGRFFTS